MANYVVVDKDQLEADLTTVGNAIRSKGGTTGKLAFPTGMKNAVDAIQKGIDTSSNKPATASDMVSGKEAFVNGAKVTGAMHPLNETVCRDFSTMYHDPTYEEMAYGINFEKGYYTNGETVWIGVPDSNYGDATPEDVTKGKFFTSSSGLKVEGTAEPSSGGNVQIATGTFTANGSNRPYIDIECGFAPDVLFISLPESYTNYQDVCVNDIGINMAKMEVGEIAQGVSLYGLENSSTFDVTFVAAFVIKKETGFSIYSVYEQDMNANWWYTTKTYSYKAITFNYEEPALGNGWYDGVPYDLSLTSGIRIINTSGKEQANGSYMATDYLPCEGVSDFIVYSPTLTQTWRSTYNAFYDKNKMYICGFAFNNSINEGMSVVEYNRLEYDENFEIPSNAAYVRFSHDEEWITQLTFTPVKG